MYLKISEFISRLAVRQHYVSWECKGSISEFYVKRVFGPNGSEGHRIWIFQNKNPKISLISPKWYFGYKRDFVGFILQNYSNFVIFEPSGPKNSFYVKIWDRTFAFSAHDFLL